MCSASGAAQCIDVHVATCELRLLQFETCVGVALTLLTLESYCRNGRLTIESTATIPTPEAVVMAAEAGTEAQSRAEPEDLDGPEDEVDSLKDDFDAPDIPAVDFA